MRTFAALLAVVLGSGQPAISDRPATTVPVLVELFTSEGCSSCPPADAALATLLEQQPIPGTRIVALAEHVDYWNDLGWKDLFSSAIFSRRQAAYVGRLRLGGSYTPQLVAGGRFQAVASDSARVRAAIEKASRSTAGRIVVQVEGTPGADRALRIEARWEAGVRAEVVLAAVTDHATNLVTAGENAGRTLSHVAVARSMTIVGTGEGAFSGRAGLAAFRSEGATRAVVFVQEPGGGPVHAVDSVELD